MSKLKITVIVSMLVILIITTFFVLFINGDFGFFGLKPSIQENNIPLVISYPNSMFMPMYGNNMTICTIKFLLEFNGTLSENTQVQIINATCMSYVPYNITVNVGFPQAIPYSLKSIIGNNSTFLIGWGGTEVLTFRDNSSLPSSPFIPVANFHGIYPSYPNDIYFPVSGDYSPIIEISNQSEELNPQYSPIIYSYDQIKVHVASTTEIETLSLDTVNLSLTFAIFALSWIGVLALTYQFIKEKDENQFPINIIITPDTTNTTPTKKEGKTTELAKVQPIQENLIVLKIKRK